MQRPFYLSAGVGLLRWGFPSESFDRGFYWLLRYRRSHVMAGRHPGQGNPSILRIKLAIVSVDL